MKEYREIIKKIAENPFVPLYNSNGGSFCLQVNNEDIDIFSENKSYHLAKQERGTQNTSPLFLDISKENLECFINSTRESKLSKPGLYTETKSTEPQILSIMLNHIFPDTKELWWEESLFEDPKIFNINFLLEIQYKFRKLIYEANPDLKHYIPNHWIEIALLGAVLKEDSLGFVEKLPQSDKVDSNIQTIINKEYAQFLELLKSNKLSQKHKEFVVKNLILLRKKKLIPSGYPFPFDTKGKKIEKVSIKLVKTENNQDSMDK